MEMIGGVALLVVGVILPVATVAARDDRGRLRYVLAHTTKLALLGGGLLALTVVVAARPIVVLLGGEEFAPAASVLRIQAPVVLTIFLIYAWTAFLDRGRASPRAGPVHADRLGGAVPDRRAAHRPARRRGRGAGGPCRGRGAHRRHPARGAARRRRPRGGRGRTISRVMPARWPPARASRSRSSPWRRRPWPPLRRPRPSPASRSLCGLCRRSSPRCSRAADQPRARRDEADSRARVRAARGLDSRRAHGSPRARGGPGAARSAAAAPRPSARPCPRRPPAGARGSLAAAVKHLDDAVRDGIDVPVGHASRRRRSPRSARSTRRRRCTPPAPPPRSSRAAGCGRRSPTRGGRGGSR